MSVTVAQPAAASAVNGVVTVRGRASGPVGLFKVELFVGESLKDFQVVEPANGAVDFTLRWDSSGAAAALAELVVVACGGTPDALVRGASSVPVRVEGGSTTTAAPVRLVAAPAGEGEGSGGTSPGIGVVFALGGLAGLVAGTRLRRARRPIPAARTPAV